MVITYPVGSGLYVNLTNRCPCACECCLRKSGPGVNGKDSLWLTREPTVAEVIADLEARDLSVYKEVVFCGYGEPTERLADLLEVARHLRQKAPEMPIRINTNGLADLIHGRDTAGDLKGLVDVVSISLNTPDPDEYFRVCHPKFGPQSYAAMLKYARDCVAVVPKVVMTVVDEPVTSLANQEKCRQIAASAGAVLRVRPFVGEREK